MKKVLIISPYFPPDNAADMHRVRQSIPFYEAEGWTPVILCADSVNTEAYKDDTLLQTIPAHIQVHRVKPYSPGLTRKIGLGSLALRSLIPFYFAGNTIIKSEKPDLIFFSTTQFPVMILGKYWKQKFNIPYLLDFQDPWHTDHYMKLPPDQRPPKYWFSYRLNKFLEPLAVKSANGLMAVSSAYTDTLKARYPEIKNIPEAIIPFGASESDVDEKYVSLLPDFFPAQKTDEFRIVYTGVINQEMLPVIRKILQAGRKISKELNNENIRIHFYFIGTSYGSGAYRKYKLKELLEETQTERLVTEIPERISFLTALQIQKHADLLLLPGTTDANYIASKLAPYLQSGRPVFSLFRESSEAYPKLLAQKRVVLTGFPENGLGSEIDTVLQESFLYAIRNAEMLAAEVIVQPELYSAKLLSKAQTDLFSRVSELYDRK